MRLSQRISNLKPSYVFLFLAVLIGGYIRLARVLVAPLPLGDGGMFYSMTQDLINNQFRLPLLVSYNHLNLPYAYPPLGFYLGGLITQVFRVDLLDVMRILPAVFSLAAIPAFYIFVRNFIKDEFQLIIATLMFAFLPATFDWLILGGGLTRAPAYFFSILALHFIYHLFTQNKPKDVLFASVFSALTLLTHPQIVLFTAVSALVLFLALERTLSGLKKSLCVATLTLLLSAPWWLTVLIRHGVDPFFAAAGTGGYNLDAVIGFFKLDLSKEIGLETIGVLGFIGLVWYLSEKRFFLPVWFFVTFIIDPRSAPRNLALLYPIFGSYALVNLFIFFNRSKRENTSENTDYLPGTLSKAILLLLIGQWIFSAFSTSLMIDTTFSLSEEDKIAADWIRENTHPDSQFLVLTGLEPLSDPFSEWLPALTGRESIATTQGKEWDTTRDFDEVLLLYWKSQNCLNKEKSCLYDVENEFNISYDYIYIRNTTLLIDGKLETYNSSMIANLVETNVFESAYKTEHISILKRK